MKPTPEPAPKKISIHASREGSDEETPYRERFRNTFQSTLPAREATFGRRGTALWTTISIHASREGSDLYAARQPAPYEYFNPRFPRGKRHRHIRVHGGKQYFNPRFPRGKRLHKHGQNINGSEFQSTLPAREATGARGMATFVKRDFNPRFPRGKRRMKTNESMRGTAISIHASREGSDSQSDGGK